MTSLIEPQTGALIVRRVLPANASFLGRSAVKIPSLGYRGQIFREVTGPNGRLEFLDITKDGGKSLHSDQPVTVYLVNCERHAQLTLFFPSIKVDGNGHRQDLFATPFVRIRDGRMLLESGAGIEVDGDRPLTDTRLSEWLNPRVAPSLGDLIAGTDHLQLASESETPLAVWSGWFGALLEKLGLDCQLQLRPSWSSEDAESARRREATDRARMVVEQARKAEEEARQHAETARKIQEEAEAIRATETAAQAARAQAQTERDRAAADALRLELETQHRLARINQQRELDDAEATLRSRKLELELAQRELLVRQLELESREADVRAALALKQREAALEARLAILKSDHAAGQIAAERTRLEQEEALKSARHQLELGRLQNKGAQELEELAALAQQIEIALRRSTLAKIEDDARLEAELRAQARSDLRREEEHREGLHRQRLETLDRARAEVAAKAKESQQLNEIAASTQATYTKVAQTGEEIRGLGCAIDSIRILVTAIHQSLRPGSAPAADVFAEADSTGLHGELVKRLPTGVFIQQTGFFAESVLATARKHGREFSLLRKGAVPQAFTSRNAIGSGHLRNSRPGATSTHTCLTVRIGEPNHLELLAPHAGHLTLLNPGSSGDFYLLTPNDDSVCVEVTAGERVTSPGKMIHHGLPLQCGPEGHDYFVALITPKPLFTSAELGQADNQKTLHRWDPCSQSDVQPFRWVSPDRIRQLESDLASFGAGSWWGAVLRYLVVN